MRAFCCRLFFAILCALFCSSFAFSQAGAPAAHDLVQQLLAATGQKPALRLTFQNESSMGVAAAVALQQSIEKALSNEGAALVTDKRTALEVRITISENWRNYLLVAEVWKDQTKQVAMVPISRASETPSAGGAGAGLTLTSQQVWRQSAPMLSFLFTEAGADKSPSFWVLEPDQLVLYREPQGQWQPQASAAIPHVGPWPRDLRGLLWIESRGLAERLHASLPGTECAMPLAQLGAPLPLSCGPVGADGQGFPIFAGDAVAGTTTIAAGRNFFGPQGDGGTSQERVESFTSATVVEDDQGVAELVAVGLDGIAHLYGPDGKPAGTIAGWGSDLAGLKTQCGNGWQVLAAGPGDWTGDDDVQAYDILDGKAVADGVPLNFAGPILALWTAPGGATAGAVVHDRSTGLYEAYTVSAACRH